MMKEFTKYEDANHGWLEVNRGLLKDLDIEKLISGYSYEKGRKVYLEEDCDMSLMLGVLEARGIEYKIVRIYQDRTPIRGYRGYVA